MNWLKRLWAWAKEKEALLFWFNIVMLILLLYAFMPPSSETRLRFVGLIFQICGVLIAAWGLLDIRKLFELPTIRQITREWFRRFPPFRPKSKHVTVEMGTGHYSLTGYAPDIWIGAGPTASIEQRLSVLEDNLQRVNQKTVDIQNQLNSEVRAHKEALAQASRSLKQTAEDIHHKLELTETSGLQLSFVGLVWLGVGLIISTIPNEIIRLIKYVYI